MKRNKGITLIALVITIIVLLILAGVAISMLSGENGILKKAGEAKTETEEAQKKESTALLDMEIDGYFIEKGLKFKCRNGYITGLGTVSELQSALPEGYKVEYKYQVNDKKDVKIEESDNEKTLATGMAITKNGNIVARVVRFGDIDCSGNLTVNDASDIAAYIEDKDYVSSTKEAFRIVAMDVNHDGYIGNMDCLMITSNPIDIKNDVYAKSLEELKTKSEIEAKKEYIKTLQQKNDLYEWVEDEDMFVKGATESNTTGNDIINGLGLNGKAQVVRKRGKGDEKIITTETVSDQDEIVLIDPYNNYGHKIVVLGTIEIE